MAAVGFRTGRDQVVQRERVGLPAPARGDGRRQRHVGRVYLLDGAGDLRQPRLGAQLPGGVGDGLQCAAKLTPGDRLPEVGELVVDTYRLRELHRAGQAQARHGQQVRDVRPSVL